MVPRRVAFGIAYHAANHTGKSAAIVPFCSPFFFGEPYTASQQECDERDNPLRSHLFTR